MMVIEREVEMNSTQRDPREMTDVEVMKWMQDLITRLTDEKGTAENACNFEAITPLFGGTFCMLWTKEL